MLRLTRILSAFVLLFAGAALATAADFEKPPSAKASKLLGAAAKGPGYTIASPVPSDGLLRDYTLETPWGTFTATGDQMLLMRVKEIEALVALEQTTDSQEFSDALVKAGLSPVEFAGKLVTNPVGTVKNTVSGIGNLFGGIASGIKNAGKTQDNAVASITGAAKQRRLIAYQYGIDPYTDFPPLKDKLDKLSDAAAIGGLVVTGAFIAIPGAAGTIISNVSTANNLNTMVRDSSAAQLMDYNRKKLAKMGVHGDAADALLHNRHYTPVDVTAMVDALSRMGKQQHIDVMVSRAAAAQTRDIAYFIRKRIELTAQYQQRTGLLTGFHKFNGSPFPMSTTAGNGLAGVFPFDEVAWTQSIAQTMAVLTDAARGEGFTGPLVLHISGTATPLAKKKLKAMGWTIEENGGL